ncbi:MAG TPA: DUF2130 domain-containing protein [Smithellaceae bacterium]|nr:DUF2130 domain-containing protein [Smithellaceae bacterium]HPM11213.1 DUF2130 domain-containing protein [Paludibacter sp.]
MIDQNIICPNCGKEIPLTETLFNQVREGLRKEFEGESKEREAAIAAREKKVCEQQEEIQSAQNAIAKQVEERLKTEEEKIKQTARIEAETALKVEISDLKQQIFENNSKAQQAMNNELDLRRKVRDLEEQKKNVDLEIARKMDEEREKIRSSAMGQVAESHRLKDLEKDKQMEDMRKTIDDLKRKAEQGSMQTQGEVLELDLEASLKARFPYDNIEPVSKGMRGADVIQKVLNPAGQDCGSIVWETKRTKAWSDGWIEKLKSDQREVNAEIAVIVTEALPKGMQQFGQMEGVWITSPVLSGSIAAVLRESLIKINLAILSSVNKGEKMEILYDYFSGSQFRQKIEAVVEAFSTMKNDLDKEKRAITKSWSKREKQIEKVILNTAGLYGDMQGIIGASLPEISMLDYDSDSEKIQITEEE